MLSNRIRKALARGAILAAVSGTLAVAGPSIAAHAACVPTMDPSDYPANFESATLNTTTGAIVYTWSGTVWSSDEGCVGTMYVYGRITDRSIAPTQPTVSTGWVLLESDGNPDGGWYGYRGGTFSLNVTYRNSFTGSMRGTLGQVTLESKAVFVPSSGPSTTLCNAHTTTFTAGPTAPTNLSDSPDGCLP